MLTQTDLGAMSHEEVMFVKVFLDLFRDDRLEDDQRLAVERILESLYRRAV